MSANGRLDAATELVWVSGVQLAPVTARAFEAMAAACLTATGVRLDIVNSGGGYRDYATQKAMYANRAKFLPIRILPPGSSTHGLGRALDLTTTCYTSAVAKWCRAHCREYGFAVPPAGDPRHFQHNGVTIAPASSTATPVTEPKDDDMRIIKNQDDSATADSRFLWWPDGAIAPRTISESTALIYKDAGVLEYPVERARYLWLLEQGRKDAAARGGSGTSSTAPDLGPVLAALDALPGKVVDKFKEPGN